ncbi:MAG: hypothetical protein ACI87E_000866 [Mariniblastus sp.]|jgi:hypothetical protein
MATKPPESSSGGIVTGNTDELSRNWQIFRGHQADQWFTGIDQTVGKLVF